MQELDDLIRRVVTGAAEARDELFAAAYPELKKLAHARLRQNSRRHGLDTTELVHEAYLRYIRGTTLRAEDRRAFFAYAARVMRSVIVDEVRDHQAACRGGGTPDLTLDTQRMDELPASGQDVLAVHEALKLLEKAEPRLAEVVEMRFFGDYSEAEIAEMLGVAERTVRRDWAKGRLLLVAMLKD